VSFSSLVLLFGKTDAQEREMSQVGAKEEQK
jgi:hypothetical protein